MPIQSYSVTAAIELSLSMVNRPYTGTSGLYAARSVVHSSAMAMCEQLKRLRSLNGATPSEDLHCTTMYSEVAVPPHEIKFAASRSFAFAHITGATCFGRYIVLLLKSDVLHRDNRNWIQLGAKYTHPVYQPHVTMVELSASLSEAAQANLVKYVNESGVVGMQITLGPEVVQDNLG